MLFKISSLKGLSIQARDGEIGSISDLLFEDSSWRVRWLVVDTGSWLTGRKVLLPASHLAAPEQGGSAISVDLTRKQVEDSPGAGVDLPVSRQMETSIYDSLGWAPYWTAPGMPYIPATAYPVVPAAPGTAGAPALGGIPAAPQGTAQGAAERENRGDPHLRSADEVTGYYVHARDADAGHVEGMLIEGDDWTIRYFIVDTKNWWPGKMVLVATDWIESIAWEDRSVYITRTRDEIKSAPEYDPSRPIDRYPNRGL